MMPYMEGEFSFQNMLLLGAKICFWVRFVCIKVASLSRLFE